MNELLLTGVQIATSIWEVWMCYQLLFIMVFDKKHMTKRERLVMYCTAFLVGSILGINRCVSFFSSLIFLFVNIMLILSVSFRRRKKILIAGVTLLFFSIVAIIDMIVAFICLEFMGNAFASDVYVYAMTIQKEIIFLLSRCIVFIILHGIKKKVKNIYEIAEECQYIIFAIGIIFLVLLIKYQYILSGIVEGGKKTRAISASFALLIFTVIIIFVATFILKYRYMQQEKQTFLLREQLLEEQYIDLMKKQQMIHDIKNHLLLIRTYEKEHRWKELHYYLEEISEDILEDSTRVWSGDVIVDLVLNSKKAYAESKDIKVEINSEVISKFPLTKREIISLFGNLLDNAIEACEKMTTLEKWIEVVICKHHELLSVEIENSIEIRPKEKNGELISGKRDLGIHGWGVKNIRQIVNKHDGTYSYQIKENSFLTNIVFFNDENDFNSNY